MNRNQKIGIGCGAAGCLGLIVVVLAAGVFIFWRSQQKDSDIRANRNFNFNVNSNSNSNSNSDSDSNTNSNDASTNSSSSDSDSTLSNDDKHKLFQAAGMTGDSALIQKVYKHIGIMKADGTPDSSFQPFTQEHLSWATSNYEFIASINTPEKARAYVDANLDD